MDFETLVGVGIMAGFILLVLFSNRKKKKRGRSRSVNNYDRYEDNDYDDNDYDSGGDDGGGDD